MSRRFTLAGLLLAVTFVALVLAIVTPLHRYSRRRETHADRVASVAVSADGSRFAALFGDGQMRIWDRDGALKTILQTQGRFGADLLLSHDGQLAAISPGPRDRHVYPRSREDIVIWDVAKETIWRTLPGSVVSIAFLHSRNAIVVVDDPPVNNPPITTSGFGYVMHQIRQPPTVYVLEGDSAARRVANGVERFELGNKGANLAVSFGRYDGDAADVPYCSMILPGGRVVVGAAEGGYKALDAKTLELRPLAEMADVRYVAAGMHGSTFIAAERAKVDLWDASTLLPRKRFFEAEGPPSVKLPMYGAVVWLTVFVVHVRRKRQRAVSGAEEDRDQRSMNRLPSIMLAERHASR